MFHSNVQKLVMFLFCGMGCLLSQSCGSSEEGAKLYDVSGTVTYGGKPVPYGSILFVADVTEGNTAPQGVASIEDGKFDTAKGGRGVIGGTYTVTIKGRTTEFPPEEDDDEGAGDPPLFSDFQTTVLFPEENSIQEFEVLDKRTESNE